MRSPLVITERGVECIARFVCPNRKISTTLDFIVDTGSGLSFIGYKDALQMGVEFDELGPYGRPVAGFGGAADARHLSDPCYVYVDFDKELHQVDLPEGVLVYRPSRKGSKRWKTEESVSLLGRDFEKASGLTLAINLSRGEAYLEK